MVGGIVVQVVNPDNGKETFAEVLDETYFDRQWRVIRPRHGAPRADIQKNDAIWWQCRKAFLSREGKFEDREIGQCDRCDSPL